MTEEVKETTLSIEEVREILAAAIHDQWAHWTKYFLNALEIDSFSNQNQPLVERWQRQINTPYSQLSEREKNSDREFADKFIKIVKLAK